MATNNLRHLLSVIVLGTLISLPLMPKDSAGDAVLERACEALGGAPATLDPVAVNNIDRPNASRRRCSKVSKNKVFIDGGAEAFPM